MERGWVVGVRVGDGNRVGWAVGGVRMGGGILPYALDRHARVFRGKQRCLGAWYPGWAVGRKKSRGSSRKKEEKLLAISSFHFFPYFSTALQMPYNI